MCDLAVFDQAYQYATCEPYGNLTIDFNPKDEKLKYRKNLNELIYFDQGASPSSAL